MNAIKSSRSVVKPIVVAVALLSGTAAFAATMDDVVKTRPDQNIDQQYGRDSVYGFSADAKPMTPDQTGSRDVLLDTWHFTEGVATSAWAATTDFFNVSDSDAVAQAEPQPYGRAGGYADPDKPEVLSKTPTNDDTVVKSGEAVGNAADPRADVSNISDASDASIGSYNWSMR